MQNTDSTRSRVLEIILEVTGLEAKEVPDSALLREDVAPTSLEQVTLFMALSDEFDMEIDEEQVHQIQSVAELVEFVRAKLDS